MRLQTASVAAKLYAIFALLAIVTVALAAIAVVSARQHAALTENFEAAFKGVQNVERISALIYAVVMEARGIYAAPNAAAARSHADDLGEYSERIGASMAEWQTTLRGIDVKDFSEFASRTAQFQDYAAEIAMRGTQIGPTAAKQWGESKDNRSMREALLGDLDRLAQYYSNTANRMYGQIDRDIDKTALLLSVIAAFAVALAAAGGLTIWRSVARPLAAITQVTAAVAAGDVSVAVPCGDRGDEVGKLARAIAVFQDVLRQNADLHQKVVAEADARGWRNEYMSAEIGLFSAEVETSLAELGRICDQMLGASRQLTEAADQAAAKTTGAAAASGEASNNVRDIASAADELAASVGEIDRQVAQSNVIASRAVSDAERTNKAVKELDEAARRIGDVVKLITDIAEQTNLLALNATIEAARAGDAGRGFAVVAGEVKALAGQTAKATEEIAAQIAAMQGATARSIQAIAGIERTIREIGEISGAIATAVTEQGAATQEIARSVEAASTRTAETADEVIRVGEATDNTRASAASVKLVADDLGAAAAAIRAQVEHFFQKLRAA
jgi:methyl-accepting chemotaxis protein